MSKVTNDSLTRSGTGCFIVVPMWQQWASKGYVCSTCSIPSRQCVNRQRWHVDRMWCNVQRLHAGKECQDAGSFAPVDLFRVRWCRWVSAVYRTASQSVSTTNTACRQSLPAGHAPASITATWPSSTRPRSRRPHRPTYLFCRAAYEQDISFVIFDIRALWRPWMLRRLSLPQELWTPAYTVVTAVDSWHVLERFVYSLHCI